MCRSKAKAGPSTSGYLSRLSFLFFLLFSVWLNLPFITDNVLFYSNHPVHNLCGASLHCYRSSSSSSWIRSPIHQKLQKRIRRTCTHISVHTRAHRHTRYRAHTHIHIWIMWIQRWWWDAVRLLQPVAMTQTQWTLLFRLTRSQRKLLNIVTSKTCQQQNRRSWDIKCVHFTSLMSLAHQKVSHHAHVCGQKSFLFSLSFVATKYCENLYKMIHKKIFGIFPV